MTRSALRASTAGLADDQAGRLARMAAPWMAWLIGTPLTAAVFQGLAAVTAHRLVTAGLLALAALTVAWFTWRMTHSRGIGRLQQAASALAALGWPAMVTWSGWLGFHGLLLITWAAGGLAACITWNIRHGTRSEGGVEDVIPAKGRQPRAKAVDMAYVVRLAAGRVPAIRAGAESAGKVIPALTGPWREAAPDALGAGTAKAVTAGDAPLDATALAQAARAATVVQRNFRDFAARKAIDLNGARMRLLDAKPWRVRTEVILLRGLQTPKLVHDYREHLASQMALPLSSVIVTPNRRDHHRVFVDFVLEDVLANVRHWPGPQATGKSIGDAPVRYGVYEDRAYAESWEPAITADMARRLGTREANLSHIISEGMTGAGKSTVVRIIIADGATRLDVEDWAIDPVKKYQTLGCVAGALAWFATDVAESKAMVKFLAGQVIPQRANYLGLNGFDNWEPGCGLPLLRVTVEEGGIIADELDHLDAVLNSARSAGVKIRASFQRAHHAVLDTNVRGAFGESLSFGVKDIADAFVLPDELRDAGADPSLWGDRQPGMHYRSASGIDPERQMMPVRSFQVDQGYCRDVIARHCPARDAWIAENCPDWAAMLARLDANGTWAKRTTGAMVLAQIGAAARRKAGDRGAVTLAAAAPEAGAPARMADEDEIFVAELVDEGEEAPVTLDDLDLDDEDLIEGIGEDDDADPRAPVPPAVPADDEALGDMTRPPRPVVARDEALGRLREILAGLGPGREFTPRDIYQDACAATGKSPSWVRGEVTGTLAMEGLVLHDRMAGTYTVTEKAAA